MQDWSGNGYLLMSSDIPENIKCPYLVTFDLDLEHNPDGDTSGDHCIN